jgi:hypothetical protein
VNALELPATQLLVLRLGPDASLEGGLLGAIERIEANESLRVLDALFLRRAPDTGELEALTAAGSATGAMTVAALEFRLEPETRRAKSKQALDATPELAALGQALEPGEALAAVLIQHRWVAGLTGELARAGVASASAHFVDATRLSELVPRVLDSIDRPR